MEERPLTAAEILAFREEHLVPAYLRYHGDSPVVIDQAEMQYVYDPDGNRYLDGFAGVCTTSVGQCHPEVVEAVVAQMCRVGHVTTLYLNEQIVRTAARLNQVTPIPGGYKWFFTNSGTEATEFAGHMARLATGNNGFVSVRGSFHGRTMLSATLTAQKPWRVVGPYASDVHHIPNPYAYRRPDGISEEGFYNWCLEEARATLDHALGGRLAALYVEPIQGNGGVIYGPAWYYDALVDMVHSCGGLVVSDEVQTGFGRTGAWWGCNHWSRQPDILDCAKGMGNGFPVGGVAAKKEVAEAFRGKAHFSTYGGNPPAMVQVRKVVEIIDRPETMDNIRTRGEQLLAGLRALQDRYSLVGDVRGMGLMIGVELVRDRKTKEPASLETIRVMDLCRDRGVLLGKGGVCGNVLRIKPPYCITHEDVESLLEALEESLAVVKAAA